MEIEKSIGLNQVQLADWLIEKGFTMFESGYIVSYSFLSGDLGKAILTCLKLKHQNDEDYYNPLTL